MIRAIIFDYFGVIRPDGIYPAYREFGGDPEKDAQFISDTIHAVNHGFIPSSRPVFAKRLGISVDVWVEAVTGRYHHDQQLLAYILALRKRYKIGLLSNIGPGGLRTLWKPGELERYFDVAIGSGDVGVAKPEPEIYRLMAERLAVPPEACIMLDDRELQCQGAVAVGMRAILYQNFAQAKRELETLLNQSET